MKFFFTRYINLHISFVKNIYIKILLKTDKNIFCTLFNIKAFVSRSSARISWNKDNFVISDTKIPHLKFKFRHQRQGNMAYEFGIHKRAESLADDYFLRKIDFKNGDIFYDCGANVGDMMLWFQINNLDIKYEGFEPSPIEFNCLKDNIFPKKAHNLGLWNKDGQLSFYLSSQKADSSLIEPKEYDEIINVKVQRLEKLITGKIKCLKLEAEGAEPEILEGIGNKLKYIEYISADLGFERGVSSESTLIPTTNYLLQRGFELIDISHDRVCALYRNTNFK
jgi:FkbM family methyltransferase